MNCNWFYFFFVYSDEEMTKVPETVDDETDGTDREPALRLLALLHFPRMVVLIVIPLVLLMVLFRDFFTRLCYLTSLVDVVFTEDVNEPSRVNEQSIRMDNYGEASPSSPSRVQDTTTQTSSPVASWESDLIHIDMHAYLSLVDSFPSLNESLSNTILECSIDQNYV